MLLHAVVALTAAFVPLGAPRLHSVRTLLSVRMDSPFDVLVAAGDGDIAAGLSLLSAGGAAALAALSLVQREQESADDELTSAPPQTRAIDEKIALEIDLGEDGEPRGVQQLWFKPLLSRSDLLQVELRVPLGLLIEECERVDECTLDDSTIAVTGALPGYSAIRQVQVGDLVRAVTAYSDVIGSAPMWQQVTSGTPVGKLERKRLIFRTEGASYRDVKEAIVSHRPDDGGNGIVTLVLERPVNSSTPLAPRDTRPAELESLQDVVLRDLRTPASSGLEDQLDEAPGSQRSRRLFGVDE